ncbi:hypothetical protein M426DRAFT_321123 [Hypoxylon sp. CI-4A]|nr:hypothetical protein M426DRAFT_321123 [Hypoxylon sp. CI-4A]
MAATGRYELNAMDNVMPRFFSSLIFTFRLKPGVTHDRVLEILRASLQSASDELPLFRRRVYAIPPSEENKTVGRLEAREHAAWTPEVMRNDLSDEWPDYDELMDEGLPQDMLDGAVLLPSGRARIDLEEGTPMLIAQANYVEGGLLLGVSMFHPLVDGMSAALLLRVWAKHMRIQQGEAPAALEIPADCTNYDLLVDVWKNAGAPVAKGTPEEWRVLGLLPPGSEEPPRGTPPPMRTSIFYISAPAFSKLTAVAAAANAKDSDAAATANDALMALLWRCVMRARKTAAPEKPCYSAPDAIAELDTTLNGRVLFDDALPWQYMGTLVYIVTTRLPVAELIAPETTLASVVNAVRRAVAGITREKALGVYGLAATKLPGYTAETLRWPFATFEGAEACFSSWLSLPIMDMGFGGQVFANGGIPDYVRPERRMLDMVCRNCNILPLRLEGGAEVLLSLTVEEMEILERDPEFGEFAQLLCH